MAGEKFYSLSRCFEFHLQKKDNICCQRVWCRVSLWAMSDSCRCTTEDLRDWESSQNIIIYYSLAAGYQLPDAEVRGFRRKNVLALVLPLIVLYFTSYILRKIEERGVKTPYPPYWSLRNFISFLKKLQFWKSDNIWLS